MEWLNASVTFLNSSDMRRSTLTQRGVWLTLMSYCIQQENGGRIENCSEWEDWDWISVCGVKKKDVSGDSLLWHWEDGGALSVFGYPIEKEQEVKDRREAGRRGGLAKARNAASTASSSASGSAKSSASGSAPTEGERKEKRKENRKGTEEEAGRAGAAFVPPTLSEWLAFTGATFPDWPAADAESAWSHYQACGWVMGERGKKPVRDWHACARTCHARWRGERPAAAEFDAGRPHAHTGGLPDVALDSAANEPGEVTAPAPEVAP